MRLALALFLTLVASPAFAAAFTFTGKLDGRDIVVELTQPRDGAVAGRYAFLDWGADVPLVPVSGQGFEWVLHEEAMCGDDDCVLGDAGEVLEAPLAAVWEVSFHPESFTASVTRTVNRPRCLIPGFDGAIFSPEWKEALWDKFTTGAPRRQRQSVERYNIVKRA